MKSFFLLLSLSLFATSMARAEIGEPSKEERIECPSNNPATGYPLTIQIFRGDSKWIVNVAAYASVFRRPSDPLESPTVDNYFIQGNSYLLYADLNDLNQKGHRRMATLKIDKRTRTAEILDTDYARPIRLRNCRFSDNAFR